MPAPATFPLLTENSVIEFTIVQEQDGQMVLNVLHYFVNTISGEPDLAAVASDVVTQWKAAGKLLNLMWDVQTENIQFLGVRAQIVAPTRRAYFWLVRVDGDGPDKEGDSLPVNSTIAITKRSDAIGKNKRGDFYVGGVDQSLIEGSMVTDAGFQKFELLADEIENVVTTANATLYPMIYHGPTGSFADWLMDAYAHREVRTMRRRTVGRGK